MADMVTGGDATVKSLEANAPKPAAMDEEMCECPECAYKGKKSEFMPMGNESESPEVEVKIEAKPTGAETGDVETNPASTQDSGTPQPKRMNAREAALKAMR